MLSITAYGQVDILLGHYRRMLSERSYLNCSLECTGLAFGNLTLIGNRPVVVGRNGNDKFEFEKNKISDSAYIRTSCDMATTTRPLASEDVKGA